MSKLLYPDFFNDVFGPIMQPGSSGGFAGPCRIGNIARHLIDSEPNRIAFLFNREDRDLAHLITFMTDRGYLGGIQGFLTDDVRLFDAHALAQEKKYTYDFDFLEINNEYPGSVQIEVGGSSGDTGVLIAASVGGGMIKTYFINGFEIQWQSDTYAVLVEDETNGLSADQIEAFEKLYEEHHLSTVRTKKKDGTLGYFFEFSNNILKQAVRDFFKENKVIVLPALLPVITTKKKKPQLFKTVAEWRHVAENRKISFVEAAIEYEKDSSGWNNEEIWTFFEKIADILNNQIHSLERIGYENAEDTPMLPIYGKQWNQYINNKKILSDPLTNHILVHSFSTNAKLPGVCIVPGPMGTGGGYLFSALDAIREERGYDHIKLIESLVVAAALGALAYTHTNASGEVGCVGESGVCCAMAAGAITWLAGGDGEQVEHAASMALQASLGIPCDPITGGLEFPCITRTLRAAVTAPLYADLALSGIDPLIPYHEVLQAIDHNYRNTEPSALCGPNCGINYTNAARKCLNNLENDSVDNLHYHGNK